MKQYFSASKAKHWFCLCCFFSISALHAQQKELDSINIDAVEEKIRLDNPEITFFKPLEFTKTSVYLNTEKLNFKRVQTADKTIQYGFSSAGIFKISPKVVLSGKLDVNRVDEEGVPYILTEERTNNSFFISNPMYFYAPRKSDWLKQNYSIQGKIAYQPFNNLFVVAGVSGNFSKSYANSDPRPEIGNYDYVAEGKLGYRLNKHTLMLKGSYFNHKKESDIDYSIRELNGPGTFLTYIRINKGYGNYYYNKGYSESEYAHDGYTFGGEYQFQSAKTFFSAGYDNKYFIDRFFLYGNYQYRDENNVLREKRDKLKTTGLKTERNTFYANLLTQLGEWKWNADLVAEDQQDINYDYQNHYTSYRMYHTHANMQHYFSKYNTKQELLRLGLFAGFGDLDIKDISVVLQKKLQYFNYNLSAEKEFRTAYNQKLGLLIAQSLYLPVNSMYDYRPYQSNQENLFVKNIATPDHAYDTSTNMALAVQLKYLIDHKKVRYEVFAKINQMFFAANSDQNFKNLLNTDSNRYLNFGVNIYY